MAVPYGWQVTNCLCASELLVRLLDAKYGRGLLRGCLELEEQTRSAVEDQLRREQERADKAEERAERLEAELIRSSRSWWRRVFGG